MSWLLLCVLCAEVSRNSVDTSLCELCVNRSWFFLRLLRFSQELPLALQFRHLYRLRRSLH